MSTPEPISLPRPAATVILIRPAGAGFEVYMARRVAAARAFAGAFVFPGGTVQTDDFADPTGAGFRPEDAYRLLEERGGIPPAEPTLARAFYSAALRELFEEAGVLLARDVAGQLARPAPADAESWQARRDALQTGRLTFSDLLKAENLTLDYRSLTYFSHWITPINLPYRFDTRFFVARLPEGVEPTHTTIELTESLWLTPGDALTRADEGSFPIVFPTRMHLRRLAAIASLPDLLTFAREKEIRSVQAERDIFDGHERISISDEVKECW